MGVLEDFGGWVVYNLFGMVHGDPLAEALHFFIYDTIKIFLLLFFITFIVGILRTYITPERIRAFLAHRKYGSGNIMAALLGIPTPFCTCSIIPLFIGFIRAGVPLGITFSLLIASPVINEVAIVMLLGLVGPYITALYIGIGFVIAVVVGYILGLMNLDDQIEEFVTKGNAGKIAENENSNLKFKERITIALEESKDLLSQVWFYIFIGIGVGSFIHGYVPEDFFVNYAGPQNPFAVPIAIIIGIPLYSNAAGAIPIIQALMNKGMATGTALVLMMSITALSFPQLLILRKVVKTKLLLTLVAILAISFIFIGYLLNYLIG
ncbi:MAG: permease [Candidatus Bilamarchaeaceae archaeon]